MPNVYVEARPKGRSEGSPIEDFVVEDHADHVLGTFKTQTEAIEWARKNGHSPLVARVRHLNDKKNPTIGEPTDRWQHSLVNRVACDQSLFAVSNPISRNRFTWNRCFGANLKGRLPCCSIRLMACKPLLTRGTPPSLLG